MAQKTCTTSRMLGRSRRLAAHLPFGLLLLVLFRAPTLSALAQLILPTTCATVPVDSFGVRLDLRYFYLLEYDDLGDDEMTLSNLDLSRFDQAIAAALVDELPDCDEDGNPLYGVLLSQHELSNKGGAYLRGDEEPLCTSRTRTSSQLTPSLPLLVVVRSDGICDPMSDETVCQVIRGKTSVLINGNDVTRAQNASLAVIDRVLSDTQFLIDYTGSPLIRSEFIRSVGDTVIVLDNEDGEDASGGAAGGSNGNPDDDGQFKLKVYVGATCAALIIVVIAIAALYRNHRIAEKRRRFFQLEDQDSRWMTVDGTLVDSLDHDYDFGARSHGEGGTPVGPGSGSDGGDHSPKHRNAWSVSDLTSDSQSIRSSLPMDRIAEEETSSHHTDHDGNEEQTNEDDNREPHFNFIAHWKDPVNSEDLTDDDEEATPIRRNQVDLTCSTGRDDIASGTGDVHETEAIAGRQHEPSQPASESAPNLRPFMIKTSPSSVTASSDGDNDNDGKQLLKSSPDNVGEWNGVRLTTPRMIPVASIEVKRSLFRGDPSWRSKVFRPRQQGPDSTGGSSHPRIPGPQPSPATRQAHQAKSAKENLDPSTPAASAASPLHYNLPIVASSSESSLSENVEMAIDEAGKILKIWASSTMQNLSAARDQKRLASP